jgi:CHAD domain-containing protein
VKSALHRQLGRALRNLSSKPAPRDVAVHEARKQIKRARASLRLLRDAIGESAYRRANQRLRDAARPLSRVRDPKALLDVAEKLCAGTKKSSRRAELASLEQALRSERRRLRQQLLEPGRLQSVRRTLQTVRTDSRRWPAPTEDSLCCAVERIYRKSRKAFARAETDQRDETLHESRKQTKYLSKALTVIAPNDRGRIAKRAKRAEAIADALGEDRDLALLRRKLVARPRSGSTRRALVAGIDDRRTKLQRTAAKKGRRLHRRKAKAFVGALK